MITNYIIWKAFLWIFFSKEKFPFGRRSVCTLNIEEVLNYIEIDYIFLS